MITVEDKRRDPVEGDIYSEGNRAFIFIKGNWMPISKSLFVRDEVKQIVMKVFNQGGGLPVTDIGVWFEENY